jgi:hypothetical protein
LGKSKASIGLLGLLFAEVIQPVRTLEAAPRWVKMGVYLSPQGRMISKEGNVAMNR